jgi:quercetin dioxygenase-like cupin family protein
VWSPTSLGPLARRGDVASRSMSHRRLAVIVVSAFVLGAAAGAASGRAAPRMWADQLVNTTTGDLRWAKTRVRVNVDHWDPGAETGLHHHPGPTAIYVLDGELEEVFADGKVVTLRTGQGIWNAARTSHNVRNATSHPARLLAVHLDPG